MINTLDEGQEIQDAIAKYKYLCSDRLSEVVWHLIAYPIARKYPYIQALGAHLQGGNQVNLDKGQEEATLETGHMTQLIAFFKINETLTPEDHVQ